MHLTEADRVRDALLGLFVVSLPGWNFDDWDRAILQARTKSKFRYLRLGLNLGEGKPPWGGPPTPYVNVGGGTTLIADGNIQSYSLPLAASWPGWTDPPWNELVLALRAENPPTSTSSLSRSCPKQRCSEMRPLEVARCRWEAASEGRFTSMPEAVSGSQSRCPRGARLATALGVPTADSEVKLSDQPGGWADNPERAGGGPRRRR